MCGKKKVTEPKNTLAEAPKNLEETRQRVKKMYKTLTASRLLFVVDMLYQLVSLKKREE